MKSSQKLILKFNKAVNVREDGEIGRRDVAN